jgi:hypothetical protein
MGTPAEDDLENYGKEQPPAEEKKETPESANGQTPDGELQDLRDRIVRRIDKIIANNEILAETLQDILNRLGPEEENNG